MALRLRRSKQRDDARIDRVTGTFDRRQFDADVAAGVDPPDRWTATLVIGVDDFSGFERQVPASGDQVLERISWVIMATVRTTDVVYRHTHSSFCVLLPATSDGDAVAVAERIRTNVERMPLLADSGVTVSVGVATGPGAELESIVGRAGDALSSGARSGPNRVFATAPFELGSTSVRPATDTDDVLAPPASTPFAPPSI